MYFKFQTILLQCVGILSGIKIQTTRSFLLDANYATKLGTSLKTSQSSNLHISIQGGTLDLTWCQLQIQHFSLIIANFQSSSKIWRWHSCSCQLIARRDSIYQWGGFFCPSIEVFPCQYKYEGQGFHKQCSIFSTRMALGLMENDDRFGILFPCITI